MKTLACLRARLRRRTRRKKFSVVLPYYNEARFITATLASLLGQLRPPDEIILVDNASTDGSEAVCRSFLNDAGYQGAVYLRELRPGKTWALRTGCRRAASEYIAVCDADTWYPPHYLSLAARLFARGGPGMAAAMALCAAANPALAPEEAARLRRVVRAARRSPGTCFTGGAGQIFRASALRRAGGFSTLRWKYVLEDHEIMHRVHRIGRSVYHPRLWCLPSDRRSDRNRVSWNRFERILYRHMPLRLRGWFFYRYLGPRFEKRGLFAGNLREQPWARSAEEAEPRKDPSNLF